MVAVNSGQQRPKQQAGVYVGAFRFSDPGPGSFLVCVVQSEAAVEVQRSIRCWAEGWEVVPRVPEGSWERTNTCPNNALTHTHTTTVLGQRGWWSTTGHRFKDEVEREDSNCWRLFLSDTLSPCVRSFLCICTPCLHFPTLPLSFFLVSPWRAGTRGQIISAQALHHYLPSDKPLGHSITLFLPLLHQWGKKSRHAGWRRKSSLG